MVNQLINKCISFMIRAGAIPNTVEQCEIYSYGLELIIYYIIHAVLLLGIGLLLGSFAEVALLLFLFGLIQSNGGGYHADTHGRCLILMVLGVLFFLALLPLYYNFFLLQAVSVIFGLIIVILLAPVAHENHPLNPQKAAMMGKKAKVIAIVTAFIWGLLTFSSAGTWLWPAIPGIIAVTMAFTGISMITAWLKKRLTAV